MNVCRATSYNRKLVVEDFICSTCLYTWVLLMGSTGVATSGCWRMSKPTKIDHMFKIAGYIERRAQGLRKSLSTASCIFVTYLQLQTCGPVILVAACQLCAFNNRLTLRATSSNNAMILKPHILGDSTYKIMSLAQCGTCVME